MLRWLSKTSDVPRGFLQSWVPVFSSWCTCVCLSDWMCKRSCLRLLIKHTWPSQCSLLSLGHEGEVVTVRWWRWPGNWDGWDSEPGISSLPPSTTGPQTIHWSSTWEYWAAILVYQSALGALSSNLSVSVSALCVLGSIHSASVFKVGVLGSILSVSIFAACVFGSNLRDGFVGQQSQCISLQGGFVGQQAWCQAVVGVLGSNLSVPKPVGALGKGKTIWSK